MAASINFLARSVGFLQLFLHASLRNPAFCTVPLFACHFAQLDADIVADNIARPAIIIVAKGCNSYRRSIQSTVKTWCDLILLKSRACISICLFIQILICLCFHISISLYIQQLRARIPRLPPSQSNTVPARKKRARMRTPPLTNDGVNRNAMTNNCYHCCRIHITLSSIILSSLRRHGVIVARGVIVVQGSSRRTITNITIDAPLLYYYIITATCTTYLLSLFFVLLQESLNILLIIIAILLLYILLSTLVLMLSLLCFVFSVLSSWNKNNESKRDRGRVDERETMDAVCVCRRNPKES